MSHRRIVRTLLLTLTLAALGPACQRGEKSCRYFSLVTVRSDSPEERKRAIADIKSLPTADLLKCDDDKVFERFGEVIDKQPQFRPLLIDALEAVGKASKSLRNRCEAMLIKGLGFDETAPQVAGIVRTWRLEDAEVTKSDPYVPSKSVADALAAALKRVTDGGAKGVLLESLFLSLPDMESRKVHEDLLIELAAGDPVTQTIEVNIRALNYLRQMRSNKDEAFDAYVKGLFVYDAARSEIYQPARLALSVIEPRKVADKILGIFTKKDASFKKWADEHNLFDWEWSEGPKLAQILSDVHDPRTAKDIIARVAKPIDASETGTPKNFAALKRGVPWGSYITSRLQLSMWALAAMGRGLEDVAEDIAVVAATRGLAVEQRTMPFIALGLSGAKNAWPVMLKALQQIDPMERADFITPLVYAVEPENLEEWDAVLGADTSEGVRLALQDPSIVARLSVVRECKAQVDQAEDDRARQQAKGNCYYGFLKTGDNLAKEKAAIGLVHLAADGADVLGPLAEAFQKSSTADTTLRQIIVAGIKHAARARHIKGVYHTQQLQVAVPNNQTWLWEFDVILGHLTTEFEALKAKVDAEGGEPGADGDQGGAGAGVEPGAAAAE